MSDGNSTVNRDTTMVGTMVAVMLRKMNSQLRIVVRASTTYSVASGMTK